MSHVRSRLGRLGAYDSTSATTCWQQGGSAYAFWRIMSGRQVVRPSKGHTRRICFVVDGKII